MSQRVETHTKWTAKAYYIISTLTHIIYMFIIMMGRYFSVVKFYVLLKYFMMYHFVVSYFTICCVENISVVTNLPKSDTKVALSLFANKRTVSTKSKLYFNYFPILFYQNLNAKMTNHPLPGEIIAERFCSLKIHLYFICFLLFQYLMRT